VIHITPEVLEELALDRNLPGTATLDQARKEGWLRVTDATDRAMLRLLERELDRGEAASIVLALQLEADRLLLDEQEGRRIAKSLGIPVTGALGVLLRARHEGKIASLRSAMDRLRSEVGFRIHADLYDDLLKESGDWGTGTEFRPRFGVEALAGS
jgi:predicted nucleic acid-binding protein